MKKSLLISEQDNIAALLENDRVVEFFVNRGELLLGDIYTCTVENILPGIDAAFVNLGKDKMGFLHANDVPGQGPLKERLVPKQKLLVQITKEPTGHKGPRVSTAISLPGRFLVLVPEERGVSISRRISEARERARLKSVVNLIKPPGVGLIIRTEAKGQGEQELFEDFEQLWDRWQGIVSDAEASIGPTLIYRDQDLLYRVIRDAFSHDVSEIIVDTPDGQRRAQEYLSGWAGKQTRVTFHTGEDSILISKNVDREIEAALSDRAELPSGGHLNIQPTEALTVIDVNSGRFTSSRTQAETVRRTNLEAAQEIPRQLRLRNIGGMVIVDFIDMDSRKDQQQVLEVFQRSLEEDRAKPQIGQLSDLGLVELTRRRQGQSLRELFTHKCNSCTGLGVIPTLELGPADNRRVITFKAKDEEQALRRSGGPAGKRSSARPAAGLLKAASASNGRIVPTVQEEEFEDVPEEILAQMPDELLDSRVGGKLNQPFEEGDGGGDLEVESEDDVIEVRAESYAPQTTIVEENFSEDEDESGGLHDELTENISAVAQVFEEIGSYPNRTEEPALSVTEESVIDVVEEPQPDPVSSSPFEAEFDEETGTYRLKARTPMPQEESASNVEFQPYERLHSENANDGESHGDSGENHSHHGNEGSSEQHSEQSQQQWWNKTSEDSDEDSGNASAEDSDDSESDESDEESEQGGYNQYGSSQSEQSDSYDQLKLVPPSDTAAVGANEEDKGDE